VKKRRTRLRGTKTASKSEQKKLIDRIKKIRERPELLLPKTKEGTYSHDVYSKVLKELKLAREQYLNPPSFFSGIFGPKPKDSMAKAYAATLTILDSGAPVTAIARFPHGEVSYVLRGSGISKEKLIGIQNYHHRLWSRFAHLDYVKKHKLYIYALEKGLVCSGTEPQYPRQLWDEVCSSLKLKDTRNISYGLNIHCNSANESTRIPHKRIMKSKENSYSQFLKHQIAFDQDADFFLSINTSLSEIINNVPENIFDDYKKGVQNDSVLWNSILDFQKERIVEMDEQFFIISNNPVSREELIKKIGHNKIDQAIVEDILVDYTESIILDNITLSSFTEYTWEAAGHNVAEKFAPDSSKDYNGGNSLEILRVLYNRVVKDSLTSEYPKFRSLDEPLQLLDKVVRLLKSGEKNRAIKEIESSSSNNNMTKSLSWSVLICLGATSSRAWKYGKEEQSLGESLKSTVQKLIDSQPSEYLEVILDISTRIGLGNKLEVI
jgi:hypothetical protein